MLAAMVPWLADALVIVGLVVLTLGMWGVLRMPDLYASLHASSKTIALGLAPLLIAAGLENRTILLRGLLVLAFLVLTAPVSSAAIARSYWRQYDRPSPVDEDQAEPTPDAAAAAEQRARSGDGPVEARSPGLPERGS